VAALKLMKTHPLIASWRNRHHRRLGLISLIAALGGSSALVAARHK